MNFSLLKRVRPAAGAEKRGTEFGINEKLFLSFYIYMCVCESVVTCVCLIT